MKKTAFILVLSLSLLGFSCQQQSGGDTGAGYGAENPQYSEDSQTGAGQIDDSGMGADVSNSGGTMNNTTSTSDTMHTPGAVGETEAASATEKTQQKVGNSNTMGEENHSKSRTTKNKEIKQQP